MYLIAKRLCSNLLPYMNSLKELHNVLPLALEDAKNLCHKPANLFSQGIKEFDNQAEIRMLQEEGHMPEACLWARDTASAMCTGHVFRSPLEQSLLISCTARKKKEKKVL